MQSAVPETKKMTAEADADYCIFAVSFRCDSNGCLLKY